MQYQKRMLIPVLTSNAGNENFKVSASSEYDSQYPAWKAFNGTTIGPTDAWISSSSDASPSLIIEMKDYHYINGYTITSRNDSNTVGDGEWKIYISNNGTTWTEKFTLSLPSTPNTVKESYVPKFKTKYIKLQCLNATSYKAIGCINFYEVNEFYVIKQDSKYFSFNESQYNTETKLFKEITLAEIQANSIKDGYLSEINYLVKPITIGDETFKPIDKFGDQFQLVSIENLPIIINGIKSNQELITANGDFTLRKARNIDKMYSTYTLTEGCIMKTILSIDGGTTWKTTDDLGVTWKTIEYTQDAILAGGINIDNLDKININTLYENSDFERKMRIAYLIKINSAVNTAITSNLSVQFDAKGTFLKIEPKTELTSDSIRITPSENMDIMKINVGTGGTMTVQNITNNNTTEYPTDEAIIAMVEEVMRNE